MRALLEKSILKANKARLHAAQAGLAADQSAPVNPKIVSMADVRAQLQRALENCPAEIKLTLAARNEIELSDADVLGMLQDLEELGVIPPDNGSGS
jgi:hypothetical protein